jgi:DNA-binding PadR family transcriptional regulator
VLRAFLDAFNEDVRAELAGAELMRVARVSSGTLYPILLRFEKAGLFESRWEEETPASLGRPRRRFYRLTHAGVQVAQDALGELSPPIDVAAFKRV